MAHTERTMVFIDHNNMFYEYKREEKPFKYIPLINIVSQRRSIDKIFTYMGTEYLSDPYKVAKRERFFQFLKRNRITVKKIPLIKKPSGKQKEKEVDISLALDLFDFVVQDQVDRTILVSGDGDFRPLIKKIKKYNKKIEIWSFRNALSSRLKQEIEEENLHYIDEYLE